jgi:hypothetical protein
VTPVLSGKLGCGCCPLTPFETVIFGGPLPNVVAVAGGPCTVKCPPVALRVTVNRLGDSSDGHAWAATRPPARCSRYAATPSRLCQRRGRHATTGRGTGQRSRSPRSRLDSRGHGHLLPSGGPHMPAPARPGTARQTTRDGAGARTRNNFAHAPRGPVALVFRSTRNTAQPHIVRRIAAAENWLRDH